MEVESGNPELKTHQDYSLYDFPLSEDETPLDRRSSSVLDRRRVSRGAVGQGIFNKRKTMQSLNAIEPAVKRPAKITVPHYKLSSVRSSMIGESESSNHGKNVMHTQRHILSNLDQGADNTNTKGRSQRQPTFTPLTSTTVADYLDPAELRNEFSSDTSDHDPRNEILLPIFCKTPKDSNSMAGDTPLSSHLNPENHTNCSKSSVPCISIAAEPQHRSQTTPSRFDTGGIMNHRDTPLPHRSSMRIIDRLTRPERENLHLVDQVFEEDYTETVNTYPMAKGVKRVSRNGRVIKNLLGTEEHAVSDDQLDAVPLSAPDFINIPSHESFKITYARQRSHLTENDESNDTSFSIPIVTPKASDLPTKGYSRHKINCHATSRIQLTNIWDERNDSENINRGSIRSIHELREAGGNARIVGEMEAILDDIDCRVGGRPSILSKCLVALSLKLVDPAHCHLLVSHGLEARLIKYINSFSDPVTNMLLMASCLCLIVNSCTPNILRLMSNSRVLDYLSSFLGRIVDDTSSVPSDCPNITQVEISGFFDSVSKLPIWKYGQPIHISARHLALQCLDHVARYVREDGNTAIILSQTAIAELIKLAIPTNREICHDTLIEVQLAISTLELMTVTDMAITLKGAQRCPTSMDRMAQLLPAITTLPGDETGQLHASALRLCLNFTNNNQVACEAFAKFEIIYASMSIITKCFDQLSLGLSTEAPGSVSDCLVLALGLLINMTEWSESARELFLSCDARSHTLLSILLHIFNTNLHRASEVISEHEMKINVGFGYISVLLGYLSLSAVIKECVKLQLEGGTLQPLFDSVEEFLLYHKQAANEMFQLDPEIVIRVQKMLGRLKQ